MDGQNLSSQTILERLQKTVTRYGHGDKAELRRFQKTAFGEHVWQRDEAYNRWLFEEVPGADEDGPHIWICKRQDQIVGQQCGIPFRLKADDRLVQASWANSLMVLPEWRMRGAFIPLSAAQVASRPLVMGIHVSDAAFKAYMKAGWINVGALSTYIFPMDARRCVEASSVQGRLATAAGLAGPLLHAAAATFHQTARLTGARMEETAAFDERSDTIWRMASPHYPVMAMRDLSYLRWRFDAIPCASAYRRFYLMKGSTPLGYMVLRRETWRKEPCMAIVDYLCEPKWLWVMLAHALRIAREDEVTAVICRTLNTRSARTFMTLGLVRAPENWGFPVRVMAHVGAAAEAHRPLVADSRNWLLTMGDGDASFLMHNILPDEGDGVAADADGVIPEGLSGAIG